MRRRHGMGIALLVTTAAAWAAADRGTGTGSTGDAITVVTGGLVPQLAPSQSPSASSAPIVATPVVVGSDVTYADLVYYGTCWWQFQTQAGSTPLPAFGNGYRNAKVVYDEYGDYFAGTVDKVDAAGRVTDVVLAFAAAAAGHNPNPLADVTDNALVTYGQSSAQADRAAQIYERLYNDPVYSGARIHVTGLSLGSAWTQYVLGWSIARHGRAATAARSTFTHFGTPGYAQGIATHFGLTIPDFDGLITGFNAKNDPTPANLPPGGAVHGQPSIDAHLMGTTHWLADYQPYGPSPAVGPLNGLASHESWIYLAALGWPAWITPADKQAAIAMIVATQPPTAKIDPNYGDGGVAQTIIGDGAANRLTGTAADDAIQGRGAADVLTGGGGRNTYLYAAISDSTPGAPDLITDFDFGDTIDLTGMGRAAGFVFIGQATPTAAGQVGYRISADATIVEVNVTGGASPDMEIRLAGRPILTTVNFAMGGRLTTTASYLAYQLLDTTGDPFIDHLLGVPLT